MSNYEGPAEFTYEDGSKETVNIIWQFQTRTPAPTGDPVVVTRAAKFLAPDYLRRPDQFVTVTFGDEERYGYYNDALRLADGVRYTFHSQSR